MSNEEDTLMQQNVNEGEQQQKDVAEDKKEAGKSFFDCKKFLFELIGTAIFAHGICVSGGESWFVTVSLFAGILVAAPYSGGHLNPAVSFGFLIKDGIIPDSEGNKIWQWGQFFSRVLGQIAGACAGGLTAWLIVREIAAPSVPSDDLKYLGGYFTGEAFGTFMFVLTILIMTDKRTALVDEKINSGEYQIPNYKGDDLTIIATICLALHFSRQFTFKTGGGLNPGIALGLQTWVGINEGKWGQLTHSWLFIIGPLLGAGLATLYYSYFHLAATNKTGIFAEKDEAKAEGNEQQVDATAGVNA